MIDCEMVFDGTDTNGDVWNRCTTHDRLVLGDAYVCEGYEPPPYVERGTVTLLVGSDEFEADIEVVPVCDICNQPEDRYDEFDGGENWNEDTGNHRSCEINDNRDSYPAMTRQEFGL